MRLKLGQESAKVLCYHASLVDVVSAIFPSDGKSQPSAGLGDDVVDLGQAPSVEAAIASINNVLRW